MPRYEYLCPRNGQVVEVEHGMNQTLKTWGELCKLAWMKAGDTPLDEPIEKLISAANFTTGLLPSELKNVGMKKLVRRGEGVYEDVTAKDGEPRFIESEE